MASRQKLSLRKQPRQERGRATVEAILQAATYILVRSGWDALTTNAVAERAGVNISSLYQYFPNKESIVSELRRRHGERISACSAPAEDSIAHDALVRTVGHAVEVYRDNAELFRAFEELPRRGRQRAADSHQPGEALLLPTMRSSSTQSNAELAAFIARTAADAVLREVTWSQPELLSDPRLVEEIALLLGRYLDRSGIR